MTAGPIARAFKFLKKTSVKGGGVPCGAGETPATPEAGVVCGVAVAAGDVAPSKVEPGVAPGIDLGLSGSSCASEGPETDPTK